MSWAAVRWSLKRRPITAGDSHPLFLLLPLASSSFSVPTAALVELCGEMDQGPDLHVWGKKYIFSLSMFLIELKVKKHDSGAGKA